MERIVLLVGYSTSTQIAGWHAFSGQHWANSEWIPSLLLGFRLSWRMVIAAVPRARSWVGVEFRVPSLVLSALLASILSYRRPHHSMNPRYQGLSWRSRHIGSQFW